jgi:hypothetical protein
MSVPDRGMSGSFALITTGSEAGASVHTRSMRARCIYAIAGLLGVMCWSTTSCGGRDTTATPPSNPVDELSQHDGNACPAKLPRAPRATYGFGTERPATAAPTLSMPQRAWVCQYNIHNVARQDANGAWYEWVKVGEPRRLDAQHLEAFWTDIGRLTVPPKDRACNADLGPRYLASYTHEGDLTGVVVDDYGCREVRLTDEPFTTIPGEPSALGIVRGVLVGPTELLDDINAR